jgi:surface protein
MFANCKKVTTLDVSNFNAQSVLNMNSMFINCEKLTALNTSSFKTQSVQDMSRMFDNCLSLKGELDLSNISCSRIQDAKMILDPDDPQKEYILSGGFGYKNNDEFYKFIYAPLLTSFKAPKNIRHSMYIYAPLIPKDNIVTLYNNLSEVNNKRINTYCNSYGSLTTEEMHIAVKKGWMIGK